MRNVLMEDFCMLKVIMLCVLLVVMANLVMAETLPAAAPASDHQSSPTVGLMSASFNGDGASSLNVAALASPSAWPKYDNVNHLLAQSQVSEIAITEGVMPPVQASEANGRTGFDGSVITISEAPSYNGPDAAPLRVESIRDDASSVRQIPTVPSVTRTDQVNPLPAWARLGTRPVRQNQPMAHYKLRGTMLVRPTSHNTPGYTPPQPPAQRGHGGSNFARPHR
jgi:hypothetical protein